MSEVVQPTRKRRPLEERFWAKVSKTETCWLWTAYTDDWGYGQIGRGRCGERKIRAHRVSWTLHFGPIPNGLFVLHSCDNPPCVRPDHLWLGTNADNNRDAASKGRSACGESNGQSKLTEHQVKMIRRLRATTTFTQAQIARRFGIAQSMVSMIERRHKWKRVSMEEIRDESSIDALSPIPTEPKEA